MQSMRRGGFGVATTTRRAPYFLSVNGGEGRFGTLFRYLPGSGYEPSSVEFRQQFAGARVPGGASLRRCRDPTFNRAVLVSTRRTSCRVFPRTFIAWTGCTSASASPVHAINQASDIPLRNANQIVHEATVCLFAPVTCHLLPFWVGKLGDGLSSACCGCLTGARFPS